MSTATATKSPTIQVNPDGEARCAHRDCWGNVCPACFTAAPFLQEVYGMTYSMTGAEYLDGTPENVSPATPPVALIDPKDLAVGDAILGYTMNASKPTVVREVVALPNGTGVTNQRGTRMLIKDARVAVVRA